MKNTVFYSWQGDLENRLNRSFISDALKKAAKEVSKDAQYDIDAVIDRDTFGIGGSPSIVEAITAKIARSDVFVCDVSIINSTEAGKKTPNPNVLFELGFASSILGWDRIIMIQNVAFGGIESLPFDLRGRRILQYNYNESTSNTSEEKKKVVTQLVSTLKAALIHYANDEISKDKVIWWGKWNVQSKIKVRGAILDIFRVSSDSFLFNLTLFDGARSGEMEGKAQILTPHSALARIQTVEGQYNCLVVFRRRLENDSWWIDIEVNENCHCFHGLGANFKGSYKHETEQVVNYRFLDELDLNELHKMTGKYLPTFLENFQQIGYVENLDGGEVLVISGGVKGLYGSMQSIVALDQRGNIWCAFIDPEEDVIRYFSNNLLDCLSIDKWMANFTDKDIIKNEDNSFDKE